MNTGYPPQDVSQPTPPQGAPARVALRQPELKPVMTYLLIGICVVIYLLQYGSQLQTGIDWPAVLGAKVNALIEQGQVWRFFTPMFLHASILHIAFNMYALYVIGRPLERFYGHRRYLALFVLSGFAGNVFSFIFTSSASLGASTAIFGLLAGEGIFFYQNRELYGQYARSALVQVVSIAAVNLVIGLSPGIDNWGHIGGLVGGSLFAWFAGPLMGVSGIYPNFSLSDRREGRSVFLAVMGVGSLFVFLAALVMILRR